MKTGRKGNFGEEPTGEKTQSNWFSWGTKNEKKPREKKRRGISTGGRPVKPTAGGRESEVMGLKGGKSPLNLGPLSSKVCTRKKKKTPDNLPVN